MPPSKRLDNIGVADPMGSTYPWRKYVEYMPGSFPGEGPIEKQCDLMDAPGVTGKPSGGEKVIIDGVRKGSVATCQAEGLTKEQAASFEKISDIESLFEAADCPAIAARLPSWFRVPPSKMRREALDRMRARKAPPPSSYESP